MKIVRAQNIPLMPGRDAVQSGCQLATTISWIFFSLVEIWNSGCNGLCSSLYSVIDCIKLIKLGSSLGLFSCIVFNWDLELWI